MAKCQFKMPDDFLMKLSSLGSDMDRVSEDVLKAGGEILVKNVRDNLDGVIGKGKTDRSTGELKSSLGLSPVRVNKDGNSDIKVGFAEPRKDGDSNAKIANILEYGSSTQPARPFLKPAASKCKSEVIETMKAKLEEEIKRR